MGCYEMDTQEHCLLCEKLYPKDTRNPTIVYGDIFINDFTKQKAVVQLFADLPERREDTSSSNIGPSCCPERDMYVLYDC